MSEIDGDSERSGPGSKTRVMCRFLVRWMGSLGFCFEFGSSSDVRGRGKLMFRFVVRRG